jgi:hypothetical protein
MGKRAKLKYYKKKHTEQEHRNTERANRLNHRNTGRELKTHRNLQNTKGENGFEPQNPERELKTEQKAQLFIQKQRESEQIKPQKHR